MGIPVPSAGQRQAAARLLTVLLVVAGLAYGARLQRAPVPRPGTALRIMSWNLRNFPVVADAHAGAGRDPPHDLARVRAVLARWAPDVVAFQEIRDPTALARLLGEAYAIVASAHGGGHEQHLAIAWRRERVRAVGQPHEDLSVALHSGAHADAAAALGVAAGALRPGLAIRLAHRDTGARFTVMTVHLKARPAGAAIRRAQWLALGTAARETLQRDPDLIVLGDFNVTGGTDVGADATAERAALERALGTAGLSAVEVGPCTAYWQGVRHDAWLEPARLDLVFVSGFGDVTHAAAATHCRRHGCSPFRSTDQHPEPTLTAVSDHCPVIVDLDPLP